MSDADLVAELNRLHREELAYFEYLAQAPIEEKPSIYSRSAAAIERLDAEVMQHMLQAMTNGKRALEAEAERDRLRAALERIVNVDPETDLGAFYIFAKETAREALAADALMMEGMK